MLRASRLVIKVMLMKRRINVFPPNSCLLFSAIFKYSPQFVFLKVCVFLVRETKFHASFSLVSNYFTCRFCCQCAAEIPSSTNKTYNYVWSPVWPSHTQFESGLLTVSRGQWRDPPGTLETPTSRDRRKFWEKTESRQRQFGGALGNKCVFVRQDAEEFV